MAEELQMFWKDHVMSEESDNRKTTSSGWDWIEDSMEGNVKGLLRIQVSSSGLAGILILGS